MTLAVPSAHQAYRAAADLAPPPAPVRQEVTWDYVTRRLNEPMDVRTDHWVAAGGGVFFLIAGLACGAWLQIG